MNLSILTLNLHTYQEKDQDKKFDIIVNATNQLKPNIICFQECAQHKDSLVIKEVYNRTVRQTNMAEIISERILKNYNEHYHYFWDWSHIGFDLYEEGLAILTRNVIDRAESRYVSRTQDKYYWLSRNIVMCKIYIESIGYIYVFSVHLGWWNDKDEPFQKQFDNLFYWVKELEKEDVAGIFLCGDWNNDFQSPGYKYILENSNLVDQYILANPKGVKDATIGSNIDGWKNSFGTERIDYIFLNSKSKLKVTKAERIFTENNFGRVSDHCGLYMEFEKT